MRQVLISAAIGYVLGSIPFGYLLVRGFRGSDVRTTGSGNIGATNVARTSLVLGVATLFLDAMKGLLAVVLSSILMPGNRTAAFVAAFSAICGHVFPAWLRFRGGKGVATGAGCFLLLAPRATLLAILIFLLLVAAFRLVSLASIVAAMSLAALAMVFPGPHRGWETALVIAGSALIVLKHHQNIRRLFNGTEPRFGVRRS